jgi:hypothetical protein
MLFLKPSMVALVGLEVSVLDVGPKVCEGDENQKHDFFRRGSKAVGLKILRQVKKL